MLSDLVCNESVSVTGGVSGEPDVFCLELGAWIGVGVGALVVLCTAVWLLIKVFSRFCRCCGFSYGIVGEAVDGPQSSSQSSSSSSSGTIVLLYLAHGVQVRLGLCVVRRATAC